MRGTAGPGEVAEALLDRAADLVAAGLAGMIQASGRGGRVGIVAEGSLFWGDPGFRPRVQDTLGNLVAPGVEFQVLSLGDANLIGSAYAALL
jgi:hexokinase